MCGSPTPNLLVSDPNKIIHSSSSLVMDAICVNSKADPDNLVSVPCFQSRCVYMRVGDTTLHVVLEHQTYLWQRNYSYVNFTGYGCHLCKF